MESTKRQIREYAKDSSGKEICTNVDWLSKDLVQFADFINELVNQGYINLEVDVYNEFDGCPRAQFKYYKMREETDKEFQSRLEREMAARERARVRAAAIANMTPTQREALGL